MKETLTLIKENQKKVEIEKYNKRSILLQWNKRAEDRKSKKAERQKRAEEARNAISSDSDDDIKVRRKAERLRKKI